MDLNFYDIENLNITGFDTLDTITNTGSVVLHCEVDEWEEDGEIPTSADFDRGGFYSRSFTEYVKQSACKGFTLHGDGFKVSKAFPKPIILSTETYDEEGDLLARDETTKPYALAEIIADAIIPGAFPDHPVFRKTCLGDF
jgi:hypothetical protein